MGYYTHFLLDVDPDIPDVWEKIGDHNYIAHAVGKEGQGGDSTKWYEHEEDMKKFSKKFPQTLFTLRGEGEESGDVWVKYFKNGKIQVCRAKIVIPPLTDDGWS